MREIVDPRADGADAPVGRGVGRAGGGARRAVALERAADRATGGVVALVVVLAVAALAFWLGNGASAATALGVAGAVLLVACPRSVGRAAAAALVAGDRAGDPAGRRRRRPADGWRSWLGSTPSCCAGPAP